MKRKVIRFNMKNTPASKGKSKFTDISTMGPEPALLGPDFDPSRINMIKAYNWYNYYFESKDVRDWVEDYMHTGVFSNEDIRNFSKVSSKNIPLWMCVNARMMLMDCPMPKLTAETTRNRIKELLKKAVAAAAENNVIYLREYPLLASIDEILDVFYKNFRYFEPKIYDLMKAEGYNSNDAMVAYKYYSEILLDLLNNNEGHEHLKRRQKNNYIQFLETILAELKLFASNERTIRKVRKPRQQKIKTATQLVSGVKFKKEDQSLKLVSLHPEKVVDANAVWIYNTKYNKLSHIIAENNKKLSIKGTTIINMDKNKSVFKRLRKPQILKDLVGYTPAKILKEFNSIRAKVNPTTGRLGPDTLILKVMK